MAPNLCPLDYGEPGSLGAPQLVAPQLRRCSANSGVIVVSSSRLGPRVTPSNSVYPASRLGYVR